MSRKARYLEFMEEAGISPGDGVRVRTGGTEFTGVVMPHHAFSDDDVLIIKMKNGYNVGLKVNEIEVEKFPLQKKESTEKEAPAFRDDLPLVHILGTGGTIASYIEYQTGAVKPARTTEELVFSLPGVEEIANVKARVLFNKLSEDMVPGDWQAVAEAVHSAVLEGAAGVVITHGTDTMSYTASALTFMLENLPVPVILVGSQRSSDRPSSDASENLMAAIHAIRWAKDTGNRVLNRVLVAMHHTTNDGCVALMPGAAVRKMHSSRRDAFRAPNSTPVALVRGGDVEVINNTEPPQGTFQLHRELDDSAIMLYYHPGLDLVSLGLDRYKGVVIAGTGLGHVNSNQMDFLSDYISRGGIVAVTTQCLHGSVNLRVYTNGRMALKAGVVECGDMLPETTLVKLMCALGRYGDDKEAVKRYLTTPVADEMSSRRTIRPESIVPPL